MKKPIQMLAGKALSLPRLAKRTVALMVDFFLCVLTVWLTYYLRLGEFISLTGKSPWSQGAALVSLGSVVIALPIFIRLGLYRAIFRYSGWQAFLTVAQAVGIYGLVYAFIFTIIGVTGVPRTVGIIQPMLLLIFVVASRAMARFLLGDQYLYNVKHDLRTKVLIYGAGSTGRQLAAAMANNNEMQIVGFLDDDSRLHGRVLNGLTIYNPLDLDTLVKKIKISHVLLAMNKLSRYRRNEILNQICNARVAVRTLPKVTDLAQGKVSIYDLRDLDIDDLIGRESVVPCQLLLIKNTTGKAVLVTGAGGSIGSELCRQILALAPSKLLLIEQSEFALYAIHQELELKKTNDDVVIVPLLASVQDYDRMNEIMSTWRPDIVYHAAAYKHVPLVEHNPTAGIKNNVFGTLYVAQAAAENGVTNFVVISTDKAVRPTNVMGASKRLSEMVLQAFATTCSSTKFSMVRFGNVLGSSGSVVPKFRQQIRNGGPITLTHSDVTRYFMTIQEAAQLVIQAGAMAIGGDVFVLDMGQPVKIIDLARRMVELSGLTVKDARHPHGDIAIEVTGLRPGEKLYEELLISDNPRPTDHPRIMKAHEDFISWCEIEIKLKSLENALRLNDVGMIRLLMKQLVTGYIPSEKIVDWVYMEREELVQMQEGL
jgi:FlaA1/EpsC-like NDP-sugar epimerase